MESVDVTSPERRRTRKESFRMTDGQTGAQTRTYRRTETEGGEETLDRQVSSGDVNRLVI